MNKLSVFFSYDKKANIASCRLSNVCSGGSTTSENSQLVEYDLNKISVENAFKDFCDRLDFYKHILKNPKDSNYGQD